MTTNYEKLRLSGSRTTWRMRKKADLVLLLVMLNILAWYVPVMAVVLGRLPNIG